MFGIEQMVKNVFEEYGIDPEALAAQAKDAYLKTQQFMQQMVKSQNDIHEVLKVLIDMQAINSAKLDAILNYHKIEMTMTGGEDGRERIEFKPN